jgi:hypothetical protein
MYTLERISVAKASDGEIFRKKRDAHLVAVKRQIYYYYCTSWSGQGVKMEEEM